MDQRVTILPISPDHFWPGLALFGLLLATGLIYWVLTQTGRPQTGPIWNDIPKRWRAITILFGLLWLGLLLLMIWATHRRPLGTRVRCESKQIILGAKRVPNSDWRIALRGTWCRTSKGTRAGDKLDLRSSQLSLSRGGQYRQSSNSLARKTLQ
jgi:hypothetical protein